MPRSWLLPCFRSVYYRSFSSGQAIDLIDEAAAGLRMEIDSLPAEIDEIERRIMQLESSARLFAKNPMRTPASA